MIDRKGDQRGVRIEHRIDMISDPALVVVDFQLDFCKKYSEEEERFVEDPIHQPAIDATVKFLKKYRESGRTPIFVGAIHSEKTVSRPLFEKYERIGKWFCRPGTEGAEFAPELEVGEEDIVVIKHRYSGFHNTDLDDYLRSNGITDTLFAGCATNVCVATTLYDAYDNGYDVTLLSDCSSTDLPELQKLTEKNVESKFGTVCKSTDIKL